MSLVLACLFIALYWARPTQTEALTIWPSWLFALAGLVATFPWRKRRLGGFLRVPLLAWLVLALGFSEVWRVVLLPREGETHDVRVATINCAGEMTGALQEVARTKPDIVLVQESDESIDPKAMAEQYLGPGYDAVVGIDDSVIVKGKIVHSDRGKVNHTLVTAVLENGKTIDIVSMRMHAPYVRVDYWSLDCWMQYQNHRLAHIEELDEIWSRVKRKRTGAPLVMGGDFNLVPDPMENDVFQGDMTDSYRAAGRGWYGTALSMIPWFRIDKVWCSSGLRPIGTWSNTSAVSDHRFVVADFDWADHR